jgi:hypothetical protein
MQLREQVKAQEQDIKSVIVAQLEHLTDEEKIRRMNPELRKILNNDQLANYCKCIANTVKCSCFSRLTPTQIKWLCSMPHDELRTFLTYNYEYHLHESLNARGII